MLRFKFKFLTTAILVAIFLGLLIFVLFYEKEKEPKEEEGVVSFQVWKFEKSEITEIVFERRDQEEIVLERYENEWKIIRPDQIKAKTAKIENILDDLSDLKSEKKIEGVENLADFGLNNPEIKVTLKFKDSSSKNIIFGLKNPQGTSYYTKVSDKDYVFLTSIILYDSLKVDFDSLKE